MLARALGLAASFALAASAGLFAEEPLYMVPPRHLLQLDAMPDLAARPALPPVEAPRPAPRPEIVMTPVGEMIFSCSIALPPGSLLAAPAVQPQVEAVTVLFEPVVAPRPAF